MARFSACSLVLSSLVLSSAGCVINPSFPIADDTDGDSEGFDGSEGDSSGSEGADTTEGNACTQLEQEDVNGDATLEAGCYEVEYVLTVSSTLELEPGVEIYFASEAGLELGSGAVLSAIGTEDEPVLMTSLTDEGWRGITMDGAASSNNRLEYTIIENAIDTAIRLEGMSRLTIDHSELRNAANFGVWANTGAEVTVSASAFTDNGVPLHLPLSGVALIGVDNVLDTNDEPVVEVNGGGLHTAATWSDVGVPLRVDGNVLIAAPLVIEPGVEVHMSQEGRFMVDEEGSLTAQGTADDPIHFRGAEPERGYWLGIGFESKSASNVLSHCTIEHGGGDRWTPSPNTEGMIWLDDGAKLTMTDCTLSKAEGATVLANADDVDLTGFANNTISDNVMPMWLAADGPQQLGPGNTFVGNEQDHVLIGVNLGPKIEQPGTWQALDVPYRITYRFDVEAAWTIAPGATLEFMQDVYVTIDDGGSINAAGTTEAPIVFRGAEALPGFWRGLEILTLSANNVLDHVQVMHGGSDGHAGSSDSDGILFLQQASLTLRNSTISQSGGWGIAVFNDGQLLDCSNVTFTDNTKGPQYVQGSGTSAC